MTRNNIPVKFVWWIPIWYLQKKRKKEREFFFGNIRTYTLIKDNNKKTNKTNKTNSEEETPMLPLGIAWSIFVVAMLSVYTRSFRIHFKQL